MSTTGQIFTDSIRSYLDIKPRSGRSITRHGVMIFRQEEIISTVEDCNEMPGAFAPALSSALLSAHRAAYAWRKNVLTGRIGRDDLRQLSPHRATAVLGQLVDAWQPGGPVSCSADAEEWIRALPKM